MRLAMACTALLVLASAASAQTAAVNAARAAGIVGERYDGYLGLSSAAGSKMSVQF